MVCGPTATGKTELAVQLAERFSGEMVTADSMQVYKGLAIGTAAVTPQQACGVPQHLAGVLAPQQAFSVAAWLKLAQEAIVQIEQNGHLPVVCGGTGLYIQNLVEGIRYAEAGEDEGLRARLEAEWDKDGGQAVYERLKTQDAARAAALHPNDKKRVIRALEQALATGLTASQRDEASRWEPPFRQALCIGLNYGERSKLYARCDSRVDRMMQEGLLQEARMVWENREAYRTAAQAIGYKEFFACFENAAPLDECVAKLKQATRNYAKRQLTWFGKMRQIVWLEADDPELAGKAAALAEDFLAQ